jgi:hypothetical protein
MSDRKYFTPSALKADGFVGWVPLKQMVAERAVPPDGGIYVVTRASKKAPEFLEASPAGWFKNEDPTVSEEALIANWVDVAQVVYIGKAKSLGERLGTFASFGRGNRAAHRGGRLIWQLADSELLLVAWKPTPDEDPYTVEQALIDRFRAAYGKPPFANHPDRMGR